MNGTFDSMLARLASGDAYVSEGYNGDGSIDPDPQLEAAIAESAMPISALIRSFEVDTHSSIMMAYEEFELAQVIGSTSVILEGADANVVMEGILRKFWDAIIEKIKAIGRWFKGIWDKIFKKTSEKAESAAVKEAISHIEGRSEKAKNGEKLDKKLDKIRADAKKGVEAAVNICGEGFRFINFTWLETAIKKAADGLAGMVVDDQNLVDKILVTAFKNRDATAGNKEGKAAYKATDLGATNDMYKILTQDDGKAIYGTIGFAILGNSKTESVEELKKIVADNAGLNDNAKLLKSENIPTAAQFEPAFKAIESGKLDNIVKVTNSRVNSTLGSLIKRCEDAKKQCDSGKDYGTKVNKLLTKVVTVLNTEMSTSTSVMSYMFSIAENAVGKYAGIVNRAMDYKRKDKEATESFDYQMYMESEDIEDAPEDDDTDDKDATTESYLGGEAGYDTNNAVAEYIRNFV